MPRHTYTLTVPASTQSLEAVRRFVATHAQGARFPDATVEQVKLAVDEACTNVVKHAYRGQPGKTMDVDVIVEPRRFTIRIRDEGRGFDPDQYRSPDLVEAVRQRRAGGYGVHLMRRLMDQVEYSTRDGFNEVCLTKYRNGNGEH